MSAPKKGFCSRGPAGLRVQGLVEDAWFQFFGLKLLPLYILLLEGSSFLDRDRVGGGVRGRGAATKCWLRCFTIFWFARVSRYLIAA